MFHSIRNLDVKLQLGHPLSLKTLDLTMIGINSYWVDKVHQHQICISFTICGGACNLNYAYNKVEQLNIEN